MRDAWNVITDHPVAEDSPDHLHPTGTINDNSLHQPFLDELVRATPEPAFIMDMGCAGGKLVAALAEHGHHSIGLEGSSLPGDRGLGEWRYLGGKRLFTCDLSRPFTVTRDGEPQRFDLIMAWEFIEHIPVERLGALFSNVNTHLKPGGLFFGTTTNYDSFSPDGVQLHVSQFTKHDWDAIVSPLLKPVAYPFRLSNRPDLEAWGHPQIGFRFAYKRHEDT